jgi:hypothetical protein
VQRHRADLANDPPIHKYLYDDDLCDDPSGWFTEVLPKIWTGT